MLDRLRAIEIEQIAESQQMALIRLHLTVTGETHRMLREFLDKLKPEIDRAADEDGNLTALSIFALDQAVRDGWQVFMSRWLKMFQAARRQAAWIPFGQMARQHEHYFSALADSAEITERAVQNLHEAGPEVAVGYPDAPGPIDQAKPFVYDRAEFILQAIQARVDGILRDAEAIKYSDGKGFSDRVWNLENGGLLGILSVMGVAAAEGQSAWDAAQNLEQHLGFGQDCPRWTKDRLYVLTKTDIALGDETGLIRNPCDSSGVAYNALRLARNEIQIVHHIANYQALMAVPWVEKIQIILSPSHPPINCACEDIVGGGENGDGVYPKEEYMLPVHVNCLCWPKWVLQPMDDFVKKAGDWMTGKTSWPEMDQYADWLGFGLGDLATAGAAGIATVAVSAVPLAAWLLRWLEDDAEDLADALSEAEPNEIQWALEQLELPGLDEEEQP